MSACGVPGLDVFILLAPHDSASLHLAALAAEDTRPIAPHAGESKARWPIEP